MDYKPGDVIIYCSEEFVVLENRGDRGTVRENYDGGLVIDPFYWVYGGVECVLKE